MKRNASVLHIPARERYSQAVVETKQSGSGKVGDDTLYVDKVSCGQKRSFQSVPKGSQEVDLLNRRGAP